MAENILVGDIGSTKSTWWTNLEGNSVFSLTGFNPVAHDPQVGVHMFEQLWQVTEGAKFSRIWYYGSGIVNDHVAGMVKESLLKFFPSAQVEVNSDLLGAAIAACAHRPGTIAILGTGSHAAVYDGKTIIRQANSLGYILGDEGGGSDIGKAMVQSYFYQQMPTAISEVMLEKIGPSRSEFLHKLYHAPAPNQFLAEFVSIAKQFEQDPWMIHLIRSRFNLFIINHLLPLHPTGPVQVVGSIGTIFAGLFRQEMSSAGLQTGEFIQDPSHRLFEMHLKYDQ
ncbi:MAG TPA: hypothetical protein VJ508_20895 [Saprospiraceae bacterium]|nr:hypothetical protein [Saprospiraceae bacterium]